MDRRERRRVRSATAVAALAVGVVAAAALYLISPSRRDGAGGRTVTDLAGREVAVPEAVDRLIALGPGCLRLVAYLGATDRIVGIEDFERRMARDPYVRPYASTLDEAFLSLPVVGPGGPGALPDPERVLLCRPDLVVAVAIDPARLDAIEAKTGVPTLFLSYGELGAWRGEMQRSLALLGRILGRGERADRLNAYVTSLEEDLRQRTADIDAAERPSVYFGGISHKGIHGLNSTEAGYPPGRMVGARNLADALDASGHCFVDPEQILVWDPDFVFVDIGSRPVLDRDFADRRDLYRSLTAPAAGRTRSLLPYNYYNTNIELALLNAYFVGKSLYPERFADVAMEDKAAEIMETFLGFRPEPGIPAYSVLRFPATGPVGWR